MTVFMLNRGAEIRIPRTRLTLTAHLPVPHARVWAAGADGSEVEHIAPAPGILVVPQPPENLTFGVTTDGREFPAGSVVHLKLKAEGGPGGETDEIRLSEGTDLSGVSGALLLTLRAEGDSLLVRLADLPAARPDLPPLAEAARVETRRRLGGLDAGAAARTVLLAVDASASTRALDDTVLRGALEILSGFASVVAAGHSVLAALLDAAPEHVRCEDVSALPEAVLRARADRPLRSVFAASSAQLVRSLPAGTAVLFVTDALPADFELLAPLTREDGVLRHLVVLGSREDWAVESAGVTLPGGATVIDVAELSELPEPQHSGRLGEIADSLLRGLTEPAQSPDRPTSRSRH
ncbi:hypothetical protein [Brevibacterium salitolerans]|uniref:VWA domain-containing protein n=1 Tax=Brevibacterium salitolerans TaxID=1403566 RepID=A0ABN2X057_9MICO